MSRDLLGKLGLADEAMKSKTRLTIGQWPSWSQPGEAEVGLQQIVAILPVKGADLVGPLPGELQNIIVYAAGISARAAEPKAPGAPFDRVYGDAAGGPDHARPRVSSRAEGGRQTPQMCLRHRTFVPISCLTSTQLRRYIPPHFTAGGELRPSERPAGSPFKPLKVVAFDTLRLVDYGVTPRQKQAQTLPLTSESQITWMQDRGRRIVVLCKAKRPSAP